MRIMKKFYFIMTSLLLFVAMQANAQVSSFADLFGKYQFTAEITETQAGGPFAYLFSENCEVEIVKAEDEYNNGYIFGFAGATDYELQVSSIDLENNTFTVINPNYYYTLWTGCYVGVTNTAGDIPFGQDGFEIVFSYNPETKEITTDDFAIAEFEFGSDGCTGTTILAQVANVKMTLKKEAAVNDISGDWVFTPVKGDSGTKPDSTIPAEFSINLAKKTDDNKTYDATISIEGYNPVTLSAEFNGSILKITYDNTILDEANDIYFVEPYSFGLTESFDFTLVSENEFTLNYGFGLANSTLLQYYSAGNLTRATAEEPAPAFDWSGTFTVKGNVSSTDFPAEFDIVVELDNDGYYNLTTVMGTDLYDLNWGYPSLEISENAKSATLPGGINIGGTSPVFLQLADANETITFTVNDDGTISSEDFKIIRVDYSSQESNTVAEYTNIVITRVTDNEEGDDNTGDGNEGDNEEGGDNTGDGNEGDNEEGGDNTGDGNEGDNEEGDDNVNSIENVTIENSTVIYDLTGRRVKEITNAGIYIINGKKQVIK